MILTINAGNMHITMGVYEEDKMLFTSVVSTAANRTKYEIAISIKNMFALYEREINEIEGTIVSSSALHLTQTLIDAIELLCNKTPLVVGTGMKTGLNILIDNPAQMGSDIVAVCVAAIAKYEKPLIAIQLGTATVMSAINSKSQHIGCAIIPGMELSFDALSGKAAQLPHIRIQKPDRYIGSNTIDAMQSGIFYGTICMINGMIERFEAELGEKCNVVITGEMAEEIHPFMDSKTIYDAHLLLDGLHLLYCKNK